MRTSCSLTAVTTLRSRRRTGNAATAALDALFAGDREGHDQAAAEVAVAELGDCDVIALAQFSLSPAAPLVAEKTSKPVLTTPDTSVMKLRKMLG